VIGHLISLPIVAGFGAGAPPTPHKHSTTDIDSGASTWSSIDEAKAACVWANTYSSVNDPRNNFELYDWTVPPHTGSCTGVVDRHRDRNDSDSSDNYRFMMCGGAPSTWEQPGNQTVSDDYAMYEFASGSWVNATALYSDQPSGDVSRGSTTDNSDEVGTADVIANLAESNGYTGTCESRAKAYADANGYKAFQGHRTGCQSVGASATWHFWNSIKTKTEIHSFKHGTGLAAANTQWTYWEKRKSSDS